MFKRYCDYCHNWFEEDEADFMKMLPFFTVRSFDEITRPCTKIGDDGVTSLGCINADKESQELYQKNLEEYKRIAEEAWKERRKIFSQDVQWDDFQFMMAVKERREEYE